MSRAFLKENDGWNFCKSKGESCMYAEADGTCLFNQCKLEAEKVEIAGDD